jgi:hypothetical protein
MIIIVIIIVSIVVVFTFGIVIKFSKVIDSKITQS